MTFARRILSGLRYRSTASRAVVSAAALLAASSAASGCATLIGADFDQRPNPDSGVTPNPDGSCDDDRKLCDSLCVSLDDSKFGCAAAGDACIECPIPANGENASCTDGACAFTCKQGFKAKGNGCVKDSALDEDWEVSLALRDLTSASSIAVDASGFVFVAGYTAKAGTLGSDDAFVAKIDPSGKILWTKEFISPKDDRIHAIAVDTKGNVFVAGQTQGTLDEQNSSGNGGAFVARLDASSGETGKITQFGAKDDVARAIAIDTNGNIFVAGETEGTLDWYVSKDDLDAFVVKFDPALTIINSHQFGTATDDTATAIAVDTSGNVFVAGSTYGSLGAQSPVGGGDAFVVKFGASLKPALGTVQFGSTARDQLGGIALDAGGRIFVAGSTSGALGGGTHIGNSDAFVVEINNASNNQNLIEQFGTNEEDVATGVAIDAKGNVFVVGHTFGALKGQRHLGSSDAFIVKYDKSGKPSWANQFGSNKLDRAHAVAVDAAGRVFVAGETYNVKDSTKSTKDAFVRRLTPP